MSSRNYIPKTPDGWKQYSESYSLPDLPQKSKLVAGSNKYLQRDIYVNAQTAIESNASRTINLYADVLAFPSPSFTITVPRFGVIKLVCRVLSASGPLTLTLNPTTGDQAAFLIYGSTFDQPVSYKIGTGPPVQLDLSPTSGNFGAQVLLKDGSATTTYLRRYVDISMSDSEFGKSLVTQLRIASILFWIKPELALSLASHVARATASSSSGALLNLQANALGQQISASALTGPNMNYAPVLTLNTYKMVLDGAISTTSAFEAQYNRFSDRQATIADQKAAWSAMLNQANDAVNLQQTLVNNALARWDSATDILNSAEDTLRAHQLVLRDKESDFRLGVEIWQREQVINTIVNVFQAVIGFALAIGEIAIGNPAGAASAPTAAASAVKVISEAANVANSFVKPETIKALKSGTEAIFKLWTSTNTTVTDVRAQTLNSSLPNINLNPVGGDVSGDDQVSSDLTSIVSLAAWDDWTLQTDSQLSFAVARSIRGAGAYQLELRRHAIDGKLLVQARAQAVKIGQEYLQLRLHLHAMQANASRLQELLNTYQGEEDAAIEAQNYFYNRMSMLRTSIMIYMRDAVWAYKYYTLSDSSIVLNPLKSIQEYQQDSQIIIQEVTTCKERYSSDFTPFVPSIETNELPLDYHNSVVTSLQSSTNSVTITLSPNIANSNPNAHDLPPITGPFTDGSRFRVFGMRAFLLGARPKSFGTNNKALVRLRISTSGVYADVQDGKVYGFIIKPLSRPFEYLMAPDGTVDIPPIKDSIIRSQDYVDPTAFAQWTVKIVNPQDFDLTGLTGLKLYWEGSAHFN
ncbi:uncharacterized protein EAF01_008467 [Botrytis porri]|uniref:uncharacterized protein n=1 Tax=Botrytis porri TaxID=87229 RepID=UPI0018FF4230|nr:uncharacterized protein EAF01_008467 [Botrytis porri]KAF7899254.1 hypothetical protein EAF01_008467 [Botrytis porri]